MQSSRSATGGHEGHMNKIVHVVGTGTIGEPLIGLFADFKKYLGIDEISFHKRTPMTTERAKVNHLLQRGAKLAVDPDKIADFEALGHTVSYDATEALERATVVIDCTPAGNENKKEYVKLTGPKGFLAQGSESGFGKPYAMGINDEALVPGQDRFLQIVSCNTHNIAALVKTLAYDGDGSSPLEKGRFVCMRRSNDVSQDSSFSPAPAAGKHDDPLFGTHHARDASRLLETIGWKPNLFSSAMKLNTQYMHSLWFDLEFDRPMTKEKAIEKLRANRRIAMTEKRSSNQIFSFGRDHGYYGRILSQAVVAVPTLTVSGDREVIGFCFTPQDGNSLASSIAAALWLMDPDYQRQERLSVLDRFFFREI
jgi:glyceraldehyde-3-phosphate dehydrogenase (NAD(P))